MATPFHTNVSLAGYFHEDSQFTVLLASGITAADVGKALAKDGTVANRYKLAADGEIVEGRLEVVESRTVEGTLVGTMARRFSNWLPVKAADALAPGDRILGAGNGEIRKSLTTMDYRWVVNEVTGGFASVMAS
jgi:hypothetical protein